MRQLRIVLVGDPFTHFDDRRSPLDDLPHWSYVAPLVQRIPIDISVARVLSSGAFEPYDLRLLARVVEDHAAFKIRAEVETMTQAMDRTFHVSFKFLFEAFSPEVAKTSLAAVELAEKRKAAGTKRAQLRRSISGS